MSRYEWTYDVFINFRGADTRRGFTGNLYRALTQRGIRTFMDDQRVEMGEEITQALLKAIKQSRIAIVVLSKGYASSPYCLDELAKICEDFDEKGRLVFPVYYDIDPSDVRYQRGNYTVAFDKHEERYQDNKAMMQRIQRWRTALHKVANLSGFTFNHWGGYEYQFIESIVKHVSSEISRTPLHITDCPVGLESQKANPGIVMAGYDVFLSFRGADTRMGFTGHLYSALTQRGILTFMDDGELQSGEPITPALQQSRIAVVVFSKGYPFSSFCLDELTKICDCFDKKDLLVYPVFYDVDPSDVRHHRGSYKEAFHKHEERFKDNKEMVHRWRTALRQVANLSGFLFKQGDGYEYEFIQRIVKEISSKIYRTSLQVASYPVGLESRVRQVNSLLDIWSDDEVHMVGIYGIGGIGKTTLARAVFNSNAIHFEGSSCFLEDVRVNSDKYGLVHLQDKLLSDILGDMDIKLDDKMSIRNKILIIKQRLPLQKVLLVLDDVDRIEQLQALVGATTWFGSGSRVIITTRDKSLLEIHGIERTYEVKELNEEEAFQLLSWNAFKTDKVDPSYVDILNRAVSYASGLPLALKVLGSNLYGKGIEEWELALERSQRIPHENIQKILKTTFDSLDEDEKTIFLDIACCFSGYNLADVEDILRAHHGLEDIKYSISLLIEKSLLKVDDGLVTLHELIQHMGREIVRQESKEPGKRSRLWYFEDVLQVLQENTGTSKIQILSLDFAKDGVHSEGSIGEAVDWDGSAFKKMKNLKTLIIRNGHFSIGPTCLPDSLRVLNWRGYPSPSLPYDFRPKTLRILELPHSCLKPAESIQKFICLTVLDFGYSERITHIPDVCCIPNLEKLSFKHCENLSEIHESVGFLYKLRILDVVGCKKLKSFPPIMLTSLEQLNLSHCSTLENFPEILGKMEKITCLHITSSPIRKLPSSIQNLTRLQKLELQLCGKVRLPSSILMLSELGLMHVLRCEGLWLSEHDNGEEMPSKSSDTEHVILSYCNISNELLPICLTWFNNVKDLNLSGNSFTVLPECIKECYFLRKLQLDACTLLEEIRGIPYKLEIFSAKGCTSLKALDLTVLSAGTEEFHYLRDLNLDDCVFLTEIRGVRRNLDHFSAINCTRLTSWSTSMLLNQESIEAGYKMFCLPGTNIPEWFTHRTMEESISFWFRSKLPSISLCLVIGLMNEQPITVKFSPSVLINGSKQSLASRKVYEFRIETDHIFLFDPQMLKFDDSVNIFSENEWNRVDISYADHISNDEVPMKLVAKQSGTHVIKQTSSMVDIQFTNPYFRKRKSDFLLTVESQDRALMKEKHRLVDMGLSEAQSMQNQQHLALSNPYVEHSRGRLASLPAVAMQNVDPHQRLKTTEVQHQKAQIMVPSSPLLTSTQPALAEADKGETSRPTPSVERSCEEAGGETTERLPENEVHHTTMQNDPPVKEGGCGGDDVELEAVYFCKLESEESSSNAEGSDSDDPFDLVVAKHPVSGKQTASSGVSSRDASLTSLRGAMSALELLIVKDLSEVSSDRAMQSQLDHLLDLLSTFNQPKLTTEVEEALVEFKTKAFASIEEFQTTVESANKLKNFEKQRARIQQETVACKDRRKDIKNSIKEAYLAIKAENCRKKELEAEIATLKEQAAMKERDLEQLVLNVTNQKVTLSTYLTTLASLDEQAQELLKEVDDLVTANTGVEEAGKAAEIKQNSLKLTWSTDLASQFIKIQKIFGRCE